MNYPGNLWTDEQLARLTHLWSVEELTARQISKIMNSEYGLQLTRNAVVGRIHRLQLPAREIDKRCTGAARRRPLRHKRPRPHKVLIEDDATSRDPPSALIPFAKLREHHCRYPVGEPSAGFCGKPKLQTASYCQEHYRLCCISVPARKVSA